MSARPMPQISNRPGMTSTTRACSDDRSIFRSTWEKRSRIDTSGGGRVRQVRGQRQAFRVGNDLVGAAVGDQQLRPYSRGVMVQGEGVDPAAEGRRQPREQRVEAGGVGVGGELEHEAFIRREGRPQLRVVVRGGARARGHEGGEVGAARGAGHEVEVAAQEPPAIAPAARGGAHRGKSRSIVGAGQGEAQGAPHVVVAPEDQAEADLVAQIRPAKGHQHRTGAEARGDHADPFAVDEGGFEQEIEAGGHRIDVLEPQPVALHLQQVGSHHREPGARQPPGHGDHAGVAVALVDEPVGQQERRQALAVGDQLRGRTRAVEVEWDAQAAFCRQLAAADLRFGSEAVEQGGALSGDEVPEKEQSPAGVAGGRYQQNQQEDSERGDGAPDKEIGGGVHAVASRQGGV